MAVRICVPQADRHAIGGGWSFIRNLKTGIQQGGLPAQVVTDLDSADALLIAGATTCEKETFEQAKARALPIILRVDNVPRDSRNRGTAVSRLKKYGAGASVAVYQSRWAYQYARPCVGHVVRETIIYNGTDTSVFYPPAGARSSDWLYVSNSTDENKRWPEAAYLFHEAFRRCESCKLHLVGRVAPETAAYGYDFWDGEQVVAHGQIDDPNELANLMRHCGTLVFPAFADAAPNTVLEARACGMKLEGLNPVGGTVEMATGDFDLSCVRMARDYLNLL